MKIFRLLVVVLLLASCGTETVYVQQQIEVKKPGEFQLHLASWFETDKFIIQGTTWIGEPVAAAFAGAIGSRRLQPALTEGDPMLTLPAKFESLLGQKNTPSYIVKLLESEIYNEQTLQADWAANTGESNVDYTPSPPEAGDVILKEDLFSSGGLWTQRHDGSGTAPTARMRYAFCVLSGKMYIFGGHYASFSYLNDVWEFDLTTYTWVQRHNGSGTAPTVRGGPTAIAYNGKMYVFGGLQSAGTYPNDVWEFDPATYTWVQRHDGSGTAPVGRYDHAAVMNNGKMYIFGGNAGVSRRNDVWEFDLTTYTWVQRHAGSGTAPAIRDQHVAVVFLNSMYIHGGFDGSGRNDTWKFDLVSFSWVQKTSTASTRYAHSAAVYAGRMIIFGGHTTSYSNDVWFYDLESTWTQLTSGSTVRRSHRAEMYNGKMFIFGGFDGSYLKDVWEDFLGFAPSGYIQTQTMDLGSVPTVDGQWRFQNLVPAGTSVTYEAWASDTGAFAGEEVSLGTVVDGQAITVRKRYYRVKATLYSTTAQNTTPTIRSIMARFPTYRGYSDNPLLGYEAAVLGVSALSSKISDFEPSSISQLTINLALSQSVSDYLKTKYPRNKEVRVLAGFVADGFAEADYFEYYRGLIDDWSIEDKDIVSIKAKDFTKQWDVPVPAKWQSAADNKTWTDIHLVDVALDVFRGFIGSTDAELVQTSFNDVKLATPGWKVSRTITGKTEKAKDLLEELRQNLSAYFIPQPDGRIKLKRWDASEAAVGSLGPSDFLRHKWESNAASLLNQFNAYYNWDGDGDNLADFTSWDLAGDAASKANWKETVTKEIKDRWTRSAQSAQVVDRRTKMLTRYANPPEIITVTVDMRHMRYEVGDILNITTTRAPSSDLGGIVNKAFQIVQKTPDFDNDTIVFKFQRRDAA